MPVWRWGVTDREVEPNGRHRGYPCGGPAGALPVFGHGLRVGYPRRVACGHGHPKGPALGMAGREAPQLPLRGARGSAARFPAMTLVS